MPAPAAGAGWCASRIWTPPRCMPGASDMILRQLEAHGLGWDDEVVHQSARTEAYREALEQLRGLALAYPCTCSRSAIRASASRMGREGPIDPGTCRTRHLKPGHPHAMRLDTRGAGRHSRTGCTA